MAEAPPSTSGAAGSGAVAPSLVASAAPHAARSACSFTRNVSTSLVLTTQCCVTDTNLQAATHTGTAVGTRGGAGAGAGTGAGVVASTSAGAGAGAGASSGTGAAASTTAGAGGAGAGAGAGAGVAPGNGGSQRTAQFPAPCVRNLFAELLRLRAGLDEASPPPDFATGTGTRRVVGKATLQVFTKCAERLGHEVAKFCLVFANTGVNDEAAKPLCDALAECVGGMASSCQVTNWVGGALQSECVRSSCK